MEEVLEGHFDMLASTGDHEDDPQGWTASLPPSRANWWNELWPTVTLDSASTPGETWERERNLTENISLKALLLFLYLSSGASDSAGVLPQWQGQLDGQTAQKWVGVVSHRRTPGSGQRGHRRQTPSEQPASVVTAGRGPGWKELCTLWPEHALCFHPCSWPIFH